MCLLLTGCNTESYWTVARVQSVQDNKCEIVLNDKIVDVKIDEEIVLKDMEYEEVSDTFKSVNAEDKNSKLVEGSYVNVLVKPFSRYEIDSIAKQTIYTTIVIEEGGVLIGETIYYFDNLKGVEVNTVVDVLCVESISGKKMKVLNIGGNVDVDETISEESNIQS